MKRHPGGQATCRQHKKNFFSYRRQKRPGPRNRRFAPRFRTLRSSRTTHQLILYIYGALNKKLQHVVGKLQLADLPDILRSDTFFEIGHPDRPVADGW
jgi:hypothetical protein